MYGIKTNETISHEMLTTYHVWDRYVAHLWYTLFNFCEIKSDACIVDVAPGTSPKIAIALQKIDFCGEIYIVEPFEQALLQITKDYQQRLPCAKIYPVAATLYQSIQELPHSPDFLVSHHSLDDMILTAGLTNQDLAALFHWVTTSALTVQASFAQRWQDISKDQSQLDWCVEDAMKQWDTAYQTLKPKISILSQYQSLVLNDHALLELNLCAQNTLYRMKKKYGVQLECDDNIQTILNANKHYNFPLLGNEVLNAKNWMVYYSF